jgi:hypothetical protein
MLRPLLVATALATLLAATPASAQQTEPQSPPTGQAQSLVGLPVYSSDGEKLGDITEVGMSAAGPAVQAEMGDFLGLGPSPVVIPVGLFQQKPDRIELAMTAAEVRESVSKQKK